MAFTSSSFVLIIRKRQLRTEKSYRFRWSYFFFFITDHQIHHPIERIPELDNFCFRFPYAKIKKWNQTMEFMITRANNVQFYFHLWSLLDSIWICNHPPIASINYEQVTDHIALLTLLLLLIYKWIILYETCKIKNVTCTSDYIIGKSHGKHQLNPTDDRLWKWTMSHH